MADLALTNDQLANTQQALMHSERLASMGQLAAGIAHEVNNPLGVVLLYAHILLEEAPADGELRADLGTIVSAGRPLQEDRLGAPKLRAAEQGPPPGDGPSASSWTRRSRPCRPPRA